MKAKMFTNKAFSLVFCLTVVLFVCCMSFSAFAVETECTHPNLKENNWIVTKAPTCTESGTKEQECKSCKKVVEYTIAPDTEAHLLDAWEQVASSSCSQTGLKVRKCVYCEKVIESEVIPAHNYSVLYGDDATCMRTGYQLKMCMDCYDMITVNIPIKEDAHVYSDWVITEEATCVNESGSRVKTCLNTDENGKPCTSEIVERFSDEDNHPSITWRDNEKKAPTCEKDGYTPGTCDKCHAEVKKIHPKHSESQVLRDDTVLEPTCNSVGIKRCLCICGLEYDVEIPVSEDAHVYNEWYVQKEADCTAGKRVRYCIYHPSVTLEQTIPATGEHVYGEWEVTVQPDCTTTGLRVKECASCKDKIEEVLPVYHVYGSWKTTKDMSCEEGNLKTGEKVATCNYCTYTKKFSVPAIHNFCEWYVKELADCKTGNHGIMQRYCENCNEFEYKNYEVEHDFTPWVVTITPVCADKDKGTTGKTGVYTRWCRTCKTAEEKAIPVTHEYETAEILEYPTCTDSGSENLVCKFCDKIIENNMIPALGHNYGEWKVKTEATCKDEGQKSKTCTVCKDTLVEAIPCHNYIWLLDGENICGSDKQINTKICTKCNVTKTDEGVAITLKEGYHPNLRTEVVEATCTTSGYKVDYCPDCNYSKVHSIVTAKGHNLSDRWYNMVEPSCTSKGSRYKTCADCDYLELVVIESTNHTLITVVPGLEPTCTQAGYSTESYCAECKQIFKSVPLEMKPHEFVNGACVNCRVYQGTEDNDGHGGCVCSCHSSDGFDAIIFGIIKKLYQLFGINQVCACGELHYDEVGFFGKLFGNG